MKQSIFDVNLKTIGMLHVDLGSIEAVNSEAYKSYIKVLYLNEGFEIKVDFSVYTTTGPTLFFISPNQILTIDQIGEQPGLMIFYNRDFYCIQLHDDEVACDGLLFNNINNMPMTIIPKQDAMFIEYLFSRIQDEFELKDHSLEEMIRTYLKQLLIKSTRLWKVQHLDGVIAAKPNTDLEFFRKFTQLVEASFKLKHNVADYADMLLIAPKTLAHRFKRLNLPKPNEIIKNRIILEAKRLLVHTDMTAKEIAYALGYDDPAYFSRLFFIKTGVTPSAFRVKYLSAEG
ncbi:MAG: helix-turn-helix domain-containing protein [Pedobacter sp.]|nr:MAG: helix-turn-helix domain-containing protein [Pedobacter sp.]